MVPDELISLRNSAARASRWPTTPTTSTSATARCRRQPAEPQFVAAAQTGPVAAPDRPPRRDRQPRGADRALGVLRCRRGKDGDGERRRQHEQRRLSPHRENRSSGPALRIRAVRLRRHAGVADGRYLARDERGRGAERAGRRNARRPAAAARRRRRRPAQAEPGDRPAPLAARARHRGAGLRALRRRRRGAGAGWTSAPRPRSTVDALRRRGDRPAQPGPARAGGRQRRPPRAAS